LIRPTVRLYPGSAIHLYSLNETHLKTPTRDLREIVDHSFFEMFSDERLVHMASKILTCLEIFCGEAIVF
jgi:hypothetical protein